MVTTSWIPFFFFLFLFLLLAISFCLIRFLFALQSRISKVESRYADQNSAFDRDRLEYKRNVELKYAEVFQEIKEKLNVELGDFGVEFNKNLKSEFDKACKKIKFDEIVYKKTITKKRQEFNRKNGANAKPERIWRYIDEE